MFRDLSVPGHDDDVVCESAVQVNVENALVTSGRRHQVTTSLANAASDNSPEFSMPMPEPFLTHQSLSGCLFVVDELVLKKEAVDVVNQSFPRTFIG